MCERSGFLPQSDDARLLLECFCLTSICVMWLTLATSAIKVLTKCAALHEPYAFVVVCEELCEQLEGTLCAACLGSRSKP